MPTYEYRCTECDDSLEAVQKFSDPPLTVCPSCQGRLRKVFSPVGVVFKGSGFYKTDSRAAGKRGETQRADAKGSDTPAKAAESGEAAASADGGKSDSGKTDGAKTDGAKTDGARTDGSKTDGAKSNGSKSGEPPKPTAKPDRASKASSRESVHKVA